MSQSKLHVRTGDVVELIAGKDKGGKGKVLKINRVTERALVEGQNLVKKHMRPTQDNPDGGIIDIESSIHVSNLKVVEAAEKQEA